MEKTENYEEFTVEGKDIMYIDLSHIKTVEKFLAVFEKVERAIEAHPKNSLYTIANIEGTVIDTSTRDAFVKYLEHNKPYVKKGVLIGVDGVAKIVTADMENKSGRNKFHIAFTKEKAIEWILQQED